MIGLFIHKIKYALAKPAFLPFCLICVFSAAAFAQETQLSQEDLNRLFADDVIMSTESRGGQTITATFRQGGEWFLENNSTGAEAWGVWRLKDGKVCRTLEGPDTGFQRIRNGPPCFFMWRDGDQLLVGKNKVAVTLENPSILSRLDADRDTAQKLTTADLTALTTGGLTLNIRTGNGDVLRITYKDDASWRITKDGARSEGWGHWYIESDKLCSVLDGPPGGWKKLRQRAPCKTVRRASNHLLMRSGKWVAEISDPGVLARLDNPPGQKAAAPSTEELEAERERLATQEALEREQAAEEKARQAQLAAERARVAEEENLARERTAELKAEQAEQKAARDELAAERERLMAHIALERAKLAAAKLEIEKQKMALEKQKLQQQAALTRDIKKPAEPGAFQVPALNFGRYHALVIGIDDYKSLPKLKTSMVDARTVADVLRNNYQFEVKLLENPTRAEILDAFDDLRDTLTEEDNLLVYYAGHGWQDAQSERGYWLPVNASSNRRSRWFSNSDLTDALKAMLAKHVMVVADSCYSGTLTRAINPTMRDPAYIERMTEKRARVVLSSGGLEPVQDSGGGKHSVFAAQFLKALRENKSVIDGTQMFERVRHGVILGAEQTPQYSDIRLAGHEGGDFLFVRRR